MATTNLEVKRFVCLCHITLNRIDCTTLREWLKTAARVSGFIGFAVGRTIFSDPLVRWAAGETTSKAAATLIGRRYREFVNIFEKP